MARLLMRALERGGFAPHLASELRTLDRAGDPERQEALHRSGEDEARRLIAHYRALAAAERPRLWFTYHVYYKAPDWIGPQVAGALGLPYAVAEASRAQKRAGGPWSLGHDGAEAALDQADLLFVMTAADRQALERLRPPAQVLADLPPFLDLDEWGAVPSERVADRAPKLLAVAMMRDGDKLESYRILADALDGLRDVAWTLDVVGDGDARGAVEAAFAPLGPRVRFHGEAGRAGLRTFYGAADLLVWPAVNEAYGMVLLEAQLFGCPVLAGSYGGVAAVVRDGTTGRLTPPGDVRAFGDVLRALLADRPRLRGMGERARRFVTEERGLDPAARKLRRHLLPLLQSERGAGP
ncbi:glycosyltransferase family 4 protein [Microvirga pudoricolor]|uniref:glycosyltransferase family 4 protein n=1 Tax=Microvirga pudoricolor TaxID=2778729 RepID=UPI00194EEA61|nr:glycosyltransferase family 4 protein [Microvirga pudoricolor]MBM6592560.1 glycosyltransferase family 4 protein [Microvirga pudoricolor]